MKIPTAPVLPELSAVPSQTAAGSASLPQGESAATPAQTSFPAVLAQANQQGGSPKSAPAVKDSPGNSTPSLPGQSETDGDGVIIASSDGAPPAVPTPIIVPLVVSEAVPNLSENILTPSLAFSLAPKTFVEGANGNPSPIIMASENPKLGAPKPETVASLSGASLPVSTGSANAVLQNEVDVVVAQNTPQALKSTNGQKLQPVLQPNVNEQPIPQPLTREPLVSVTPGPRQAEPSVPLSFGNSVLPQGQPIVDPVKLAKLSPAISQNIQSSLPVSSGTSTVTVVDGTANTHLSVVGEEGHAETGGSSLGSDQRTGQENGSAFGNKQQTAGHGLSGFSFSTESVNEFRSNETSLAGRTDMLADRTRTMNMLSSQRMQMEVMLSDESKVQVEVSVKQQQVTAQLLTDQMMLRNLMIQHEPQLDAQLTSVGLELKQFGAEVSEQGLFGQHLTDSSSQNASSGSGHESSHELESEVLMSADVEADGRLHFVA